MERKCYQYCAIGDSLTVGVGSSFFTKGLITRYVYLTREVLNAPVIPSVFGKIGATTGDILNSLNNPIIRRRIENSEIITITAGGNDLIHAAEQYLLDKNEEDFFYALENGNKNLKAIIHQIVEFKQKDALYIIRMMNLYNPFSDIKGTDTWVEAYNQNIERLARSPIVKVANIHDLFYGKEKELLSMDHIHPNSQGYHIIADALSQLGYAPLI
ncbi:GDSL-type esterase/lipase family protein [Heyndrickxia sporothermodurans]